MEIICPQKGVGEACTSFDAFSVALACWKFQKCFQRASACLIFLQHVSICFNMLRYRPVCERSEHRLPPPYASRSAPQTLRNCIQSASMIICSPKGFGDHLSPKGCRRSLYIVRRFFSCTCMLEVSKMLSVAFACWKFSLSFRASRSHAKTGGRLAERPADCSQGSQIL